MADIAIIMAAALVGGLVAYRFRVPVLLGYLIAGILIGPGSFGLVEDVNLIETLAGIGVVLLLFTLGMEFSIGDLRQMGGIGLLGGSIQILTTALLGFGVSRVLFNWTISDAVFFGFLIALSSTTIVLKILLDRGETNTPHGRIMIAILLIQDLAVLPLMVVLPALGGPTVDLYELGMTLVKALVFLAAMAIIGLWVIPVFLGQVTGVRSRELFLITILAICLGAAYATSYFGVSAAFGAFAAGMLVSRSHLAHQAVADIIPLRNTFAALFFVSLGMLANPMFIVSNWSMVLLVALIIITCKFIVCSLISRAWGFSLKTTLFVGAGLIQVGEFSFVIGKAGLEAGVISASLYSLVLSSAFITILFTPIALKLAELSYGWISTSKRIAYLNRLGSDEPLINVKERFSDHVIICGHGRSGSNLANVLKSYNIPYIVVDLNPHVVSEIIARKEPCIYGDAGSTQILSMAHIEEARVLALTCPDPMAQITAASYARQVNHDIHIIARSPEGPVAKRLRKLGVSEIVDPAFQASIECVRHILGYYAVSTHEIENVVCPFMKINQGKAIPDKD